MCYVDYLSIWVYLIGWNKVYSILCPFVFCSDINPIFQCIMICIKLMQVHRSVSIIWHSDSIFLLLGRCRFWSHNLYSAYKLFVCTKVLLKYPKGLHIEPFERLCCLEEANGRVCTDFGESYVNPICHLYFRICLQREK